MLWLLNCSSPTQSVCWWAVAFSNLNYRFYFLKWMFPAFLWNGSVFVGVGKWCLRLDVFQVSYTVQLSLQYNWSFSWHFVPYHKNPKPKYKAEMLIYQTLIRRRKTNKWCEGNHCQQTDDEEWLPWADSSLVLSQSLILCGLGYPFGQLRSSCPLLCPSCPPCSLWRGRVGNGGDLGAQQSPKHS